jgi:predicted DNA-binding transcriptional regulator
MIAVAGLGGILAWIGYTLATTPPPKPIEEIEKEIEKELEKLGTSVEEESTQGREEQKEGT